MEQVIIASNKTDNSRKIQCCISSVQPVGELLFFAVLTRWVCGEGEEVAETGGQTRRLMRGFYLQ